MSAFLILSSSSAGGILSGGQVTLAGAMYPQPLRLPVAFASKVRRRRDGGRERGHLTPPPKGLAGPLEPLAEEPLRIKKADTLVDRDEVVSKNCSKTPVNAADAANLRLRQVQGITPWYHPY